VHYGLTAEQLEQGALGAHVAAFESWMTEPVNLDRPAAQASQAQRSASNVKGHVSRFLGFVAARTEMHTVQQKGLFVLLDGEMVMANTAFLLRERGVALSTCVQSALALAKVRDPPQTQALPHGVPRLGEIEPHRPPPLC